ncbi:MAG: hypothetical protein IKM04_05195 [Clostridia bacterium]|nr:hypothetical protein [Clostridia bacterium]
MNRFQRLSGAHILSACRRIERVRTDKKEVILLIKPSYAGATVEEQLGILSEYSAKAVFEVFGSTSENPQGRRYHHIPPQNGALSECPELAQRIVSEGHDLAGAGWSYSPLKSELFFGKKGFSSLEDAAADRRRLCTLAGDLPFVTAVGNTELTADEYSIFDLFSALGAQYICPRQTFSEDKPDKIAKLSESLDKIPNMITGWVIAVSGSSALKALLAVLKKHGYKALSASELLARAPFSDISEGHSCFEATYQMLMQGRAVLCRDNTLRPGSAISAAEVYAMLTPREIMLDYFRSRVFKTEPEFEVNRQSEKDFFSPPCRATTAGLFYACANGWDTRLKYKALTPSEFAGILERICEGRDIDLQLPKRDRLVKADVINTLCELIK